MLNLTSFFTTKGFGFLGVLGAWAVSAFIF
jgi:hypothetical protein